MSSSERSDTTGRFTVAVAGDTIVGGAVCRKLQVTYVGAPSPAITIAAREENGPLYRVDRGGEPVLLADMSIDEGSPVEAGSVLKADYITIDGRRLKRLTIDSGVDHGDGEWLYYVVEGIGASKDEFISSGLRHDGEYNCIVSCHEDGRCTFRAADFAAGSTTGISRPQACRQGKDSPAYDLSGRLRNGIRPGEIYIKDGHKAVGQ